jgi:hypothetical protein
MEFVGVQSIYKEERQFRVIYVAQPSLIHPRPSELVKFCAQTNSATFTRCLHQDELVAWRSIDNME